MQSLPIKLSGKTASYKGHSVAGDNAVAFLSQWMIDNGVSPEAFVTVNGRDPVRLRYWANQVCVDGDPDVSWAKRKPLLANKSRTEAFSVSGVMARNFSPRSYAA